MFKGSITRMLLSRFKNLVILFTLMGWIALLSGCGATHTAINKRKMDVQTKMSSTVFLDPVTNDKKRLFLQVRNTSGKNELNLEEAIALELETKGYTLVQDPEIAHYVLQTNILQVGRSDLRAAEHALNQGFGAAISGALAGAAVGSLASTTQKSDHKSAHENKGMVLGSLVGAAVATMGDAMVQDVVYSVIADIQISERVGNSVKVKEKNRSKLKQGTSGAREVSSTQIIDWHRYQTRIVSTANKVNLKFEKAAPELASGLTRSIVGMF